jgi:hypothetical protein
VDATSDQVMETRPVDLTVSIGPGAADLWDTMSDYLSGPRQVRERPSPPRRPTANEATAAGPDLGH